MACLLVYLVCKGGVGVGGDQEQGGMELNRGVCPRVYKYIPITVHTLQVHGTQ